MLIGRFETSTYTKRIGSEDQIEMLVKLIHEAEPPWIISLESIGGLGKRSLADAVMRNTYLSL